MDILLFVFAVGILSTPPMFAAHQWGIAAGVCVVVGEIATAFVILFIEEKVWDKL